MKDEIEEWQRGLDSAEISWLSNWKRWNALNASSRLFRLSKNPPIGCEYSDRNILPIRSPISSAAFGFNYFSCNLYQHSLLITSEYWVNLWTHAAFHWIYQQSLLKYTSNCHLKTVKCTTNNFTGCCGSMHVRAICKMSDGLLTIEFHCIMERSFPSRRRVIGQYMPKLFYHSSNHVGYCGLLPIQRTMQQILVCILASMRKTRTLPKTLATMGEQ